MDEVKELYYEIRAIYSSPYFDNEEDTTKSILALRDAMKTHSKEYLLAKIKLIAAKSPEDYRQKLSTIIQSKFWL